MIDDTILENMSLNIKSVSENCENIDSLSKLKSSEYDIYIGIKDNDTIYLTKKLKDNKNNNVIDNLNIKTLSCNSNKEKNKYSYDFLFILKSKI